MRKKKKGSTLITVLGLSIIFMTLSGVILTAIMGTMKSNINQKETEDLRYAAEAGLEIARSYFAEGNMTIDTRNDSTSSIEEKNLDNVLISGIIERVDIYKDLSDGKVKSIAKHINGKTQEVAMANYKEVSGNTGTIFDHGLVGGQGGVSISNINGATQIGSSSIGSGGGITVPPNANIAEEDKVNGNYQNINFNSDMKSEAEIFLEVGSSSNADGFKIGKFDFFKDENGTKVEVEAKILKLNMNTSFLNPPGEWKPGELKFVDESLKDIEPKEYIKTIKDKSIIVLEIAGLNASKSMRVILVNSPKLKINLGQETFTLDKTALINSGHVDISSGNILNTATGSIHLTGSTIFGNEMSIDTATSVTCDYQMTIEEKDGDKDKGQGTINKAEETKLNELLSSIIPKWDKNNNNNGTGKPSIEFENNTFSN